MLFSDWDGSGPEGPPGQQRSRSTTGPDDGEEQLWRVAPGEAPRLYGVDDGWARVQVQGMGIASQDLTGDGLPEVYLTSQSASKLQTLAAGPAQPSYRDIGLARGVNVAHPFTGADVDLPSTAWHPGVRRRQQRRPHRPVRLEGQRHRASPTTRSQDPSNLLLGQPDGTFREAADAAGIVTFDRGRGAALADFNLDGRLDLVESFYGAPVRIWRNDGPGRRARASAATGSASACSSRPERRRDRRDRRGPRRRA